jgi:putative endonuclease
MGARIIGRNFTCAFGEIDIIALEKETLAFIEVRYRRKNRFGPAKESVTWVKQSRLIKAASAFMTTNASYCHRHCRFDIIGIDGCQRTVKAEWLKGAFHMTETTS